jgi:aryl-alcohol dehydrogenase-like predicted oxidoreductase
MFASPVNVFPIVGAADGDEFKQNVESFDLALNEQERAWLDLEIDRLG